MDSAQASHSEAFIDPEAIAGLCEEVSFRQATFFAAQACTTKACTC